MTKLATVMIALCVGFGAAACSSNGDPSIVGAANPAVPSHGKRISHKTTPTFVYVTNGGTNGEAGSLLVYRAGIENPSPIRTQSLGTNTGPKGVATDHEGNVYVAIFQTSTIDIFSSGGVSLTGSLTRANGIYGPQAVYVDANDNLYVGNAAARNVKVYAHGSTTPFATITPYGDFLVYGGVTTDASGNVFMDLADGAGAIVEECTPVLSVLPKTCSVVGPIVTPYPGGAAFGPNGDLAVGGARILQYYAPPTFHRVRYTSYCCAIELLTTGPDGSLYVPLNGGAAFQVEVVPSDGAEAPYAITNGIDQPWGAAAGI